VDTAPSGVTLTFTIDDTANQTYGAADGLAWKGSFVDTEATNSLAYDSGWAGPFPRLYDDGPRSAGGHEPEGATAGDHVFGVAVHVPTPTEALTFQYGAVRAYTGSGQGTWIWTGANGTVSLAVGQTGTVAATGLTIPAFGTIDLKITLDMNALDPNFTPGAGSGVTLKSSAWTWEEIALTDDGTKGDVTASDGVYTFVLS
jgi:hypothetical protein